MHAAAEVDLQESVVVQREGLRRAFDLPVEIEALLLGELGLVDRLLQLARSGMRRRDARPRLRHQLAHLRKMLRESSVWSRLWAASPAE